MEWKLSLKYKDKWFKAMATVEYNSRQILRIRVRTAKGSVLLQNDYPAIRFTNSRRGIKWKLREGAIATADKDTAQLFIYMFTELEKLMKADFDKIFPQELF